MNKITGLFFITLLGFFMVFLFLTKDSGICKAEELKELKEGSTALTFYLQTFDGDDVFLNDYCGKEGSQKSKKVILLAFWNTECKHCVKEFELLNSLYDKYHEKGMEIFLINIREKREKINKKIDVKSVKPPILMDIYGSVAERYGVKNILPIMFLLGKNKLIEYKHTGVIDEVEQPKLIQKIEEQLK